MPADRGILRPLMYRAIQQGASFNAFYNSARNKGISYRRSDMLADWSDVRSEVGQSRSLRGLSRGDIPEAIDVGAVKFTRPGNYYYRVRVDYKEPSIQGKKFQFITAVFEEPATVGEILQDVSRKFLAGEYEPAHTVKGFQLVSALHRPTP